MITGVVPAQPRPQPDDPMITGVVPAQPDGSTADRHAPAEPSGPPAVTDLLRSRTVSGSVPPTPPPAAKDETNPNADADLVTPGEPAVRIPSPP